MTLQANKNLAERPHILVIDDDERIRTLVSRFLQEHGFLASAAKDAAEAREILKRFSYDALVVDIMMPGETGLEFTKDLRKKGFDIPVLLLTALGEADDRISGLETGADDYLPKPFEPRELVLRLQAILRRRMPAESPASFPVGPWLYDSAANMLRRGDETKSLTGVEGALLKALAGRAGQIVSREQLVHLCGPDAAERTIDVQVTRLRRKLEDDPRNPRCLQTVRGKGYRLRIGDSGA